jgi:heme oxygenase
MLTQLNLETRIHHAEVDADQLKVLELPDAARYREFMIRSYGFEASVESALALTTNLNQFVDLRDRAKAGLIAADLLALGMRPQELSKVPLCPWIETFDSIADALGWLYVVERKTLLHSAMLRHLTVRMPQIIVLASSYLSCYDHTAGTRWRDLGAALDRFATPESADQIVAAAHHAFWCQRDWFRRPERGSRRAAG